MCQAMYLYYYRDGESPQALARRPAPGPWSRLGRDVLALVYGCAVFAAGIIASDWLMR